MQEIRLSKFGYDSVKPSPVNRLMAAFASDLRPGIDINLGVGYVDEATIPRQLIANAYEQVLSNPKRFPGALNYGPPAGLPSLIEAIRDQVAQRLDTHTLAQKRIIIGASGATSLLEAAASTLEPGIVVTSDPVYYIYTDLLKRLGFELLAIPEDQEGIDTDRLESELAALGSNATRISFFYLVTVANPTCTILSNARQRRLVHLVSGLSEQLDRKIPLLLDTAYEPLVHDRTAQRFESGLAHDKLGLVYEIGSVAKILAPALRVGYMIGQDGPFMAAMVQSASDTTLGPPPLNQYVAAYLIENHLADQHTAATTAYGNKAKQVRTWIDQYLGGHVAQVRGGRAGFYFYLTLKQTHTHEQSPFYRYLARTTGDPTIDGTTDRRAPRVVYVPGAYCVHPEGDLVDIAQRQLRLSYAYENLTQIQRAIKLMAQAIAYSSQS